MQGRKRDTQSEREAGKKARKFIAVPVGGWGASSTSDFALQPRQWDCAQDYRIIKKGLLPVGKSRERAERAADGKKGRKKLRERMEEWRKGRVGGYKAHLRTSDLLCARVCVCTVRIEGMRNLPLTADQSVSNRHFRYLKSTFTTAAAATAALEVSPYSRKGERRRV